MDIDPRCSRGRAAGYAENQGVENLNLETGELGTERDPSALHDLVRHGFPEARPLVLLGVV